MSPTVSVIIPVYNRAALLREALDSVAAQTFRDLETIVVDDGSTDDIAAAVAGHAARPRVLRQAQQGPAAARNRGVREAAGRLLAFLDSDDVWLPHKLERMLDAGRARPDVAIWYGPMQPMDALRRPVPGRTKPCTAGRITEALFHSSFVHVPTVVCAAELFRAYGGFDESLRVCEDYDLWLRISVEHEFGLVDEPLALRRLHDDRLSKSSMQRNLAVKVGVLERFYATAANRALLDKPRAQRRLARVCLSAGRAALRAGRFEASAELVRKAAGYGASRLRTTPLAVLSAVLRGFERGGRERGSTPRPAAAEAERYT